MARKDKTMTSVAGFNVNGDEQKSVALVAEEKVANPIQSETTNDLQQQLERMIDRNKELEAKAEALKHRKTKEDTHTRATFLIDNDLLHRLDKLAKKNPRGFKTLVVNQAIKNILDDYETKLNYIKR